MKVWFCDNHTDPAHALISVGESKPLACRACEEANQDEKIVFLQLPEVGVAGGPDFWCPKAMIEMLSKQQSYMPLNTAVHAAMGQLLGVLMLCRPVGPDGKHGERHTPACGCDEHTKGRWYRETAR